MIINNLIATAGGTGGNYTMFIVLAGVMLLFSLFSSRTNKKNAAKREAELNAIQRGDQVVTIGGFYGTVDGANEEDKTFTLKMLPDGNRVVIKKSAVQYKLSPAEEVGKGNFKAVEDGSDNNN